MQRVLFRMVSACGETVRALQCSLVEQEHMLERYLPTCRAGLHAGTCLCAALFCTLALTVSRGINSAEAHISNALEGFAA